MIWVIAITWLFLSIVMTLFAYIYYKLHTFMTTKECFISARSNGVLTASVITLLTFFITVDWAELTNYRVFGEIL